MTDENKPTTMPDRHLNAKRAGQASARVRRVVLTPEQLDQVEKLSYLGLGYEDIAWTIGVSLRSFESLMEVGAKAEEDGKLSKKDTAYHAYRRGRAKGNGFIAKRTFEVATDKKNPNAKLLEFLSKSRLRWSEAASESVITTKNFIIFETQVGRDGIIRSQHLDENENVIPIANRAGK